MHAATIFCILCLNLRWKITLPRIAPETAAGHSNSKSSLILAIKPLRSVELHVSMVIYSVVLGAFATAIKKIYSAGWRGGFGGDGYLSVI